MLKSCDAHTTVDNHYGETSCLRRSAVCGGEWRQLHAFLTSVLGGGDRLAARSHCHISRKMALCSHSVAGGIGPTANMDALMKRKSLVPVGYRNRISQSNQ